MNFLGRLTIAVKPATSLISRNLRSDLPFKWVRPEKISCIKPQKSGDLNPGVTKFDSKRYLLHFDQSKALTQEADEDLKKLFQLESNPRKERVKIFVQEMVENVQRHEQDYKSIEARLAKMTAKIRSYQELMEKFPRNLRLKVKLKEKIDKRKRYMRLLRRQDYKKFEWLLEKLDLEYKSYPERYFRVERKRSMRTMAYFYCQDIKQQRLEAYKRVLQSQQIDFLDKKIKNLEFIRNEQMACKVKVTVTQEEIDAVKKMRADLAKKQSKTNDNGDEEVKSFA